MLLASSAWVPMTMSTVPSAMPSLVFFVSAAGTSRDRRPTFDREALKPLDEIGVMLARQQGRRADQRDLLARHRHDERGAERDLGLAEADVAAHQPVHRLARFEVVQHILDRALLVVGFLVGEAVDELRDRRCRARR